MEKIKGTLEMQLELEKEDKHLAETLMKATYEKAIKESKGSETNVGIRMMEHVFTTCSANVEKVLFPTKKRGVVPTYQGVINALTQAYKGQKEDLIHMSTLAVLNTLLSGVLQNEDHAIILSNAMTNVAAALYEEAKAHAFSVFLTKQDAAFFDDGINKRVRKDYKIQYANNAYKDKDFTWPVPEREEWHKLSLKLIEMIFKGSGYFEEGQTEGNKGKSGSKTIQASAWLIETWTKNVDMLTLNAYHFSPCVIPPSPWTSVWDGAYYGESRRFSTFIRVNFKQRNTFIKQYIQKLHQLDLSWLFDCVNALQSTPFVVNERILETMVSIMENHGSLGGLPSTDETPKFPKLNNPTPEELEMHKRKLVKFYKHERSRISKVLRTNITLGCAKKYSVYEKIYFPWNLDYRGRIYPMSPALNPQGDDAQKSLLLFAEPSPLTSEESLKWFYIAGAGFAGLDKIPFDDRIKWVLDNEDNILQSAASPLTYTWWDEVAGDESPMCFLSFCFEFERLRVYQAGHDGSAVGFKSGLPISFDGTCSGLQHFSMLLADEVGGYSVNLVPNEEVQDIYQVVADKVNVILHRDLMEGTADDYKKDKKGQYVLDKKGEKCIVYGTKELATEWLSYGQAKFGTEGIKRKVCKRSVMTLAYGSRKYGFSENLKEDIIKPWMAEHEDTPIFLSRSQAANYMAGLIWDAVSTTVIKAVEGMEWLKKIASIVGKSGEAVAWTSPNGLPIQQNKFISNIEIYRARFNGLQIRTYIPKDPTDIDARQQAQSIAPNFIHSMDACHMQRVILNQHKKGNNNFFMIHDSFGTDIEHAGDLFKSIREEMVMMYKDKNYLKTWLDDVEYLIPEGTKLPEIPQKGALDLDKVKDSKYCFA